MDKNSKSHLSFINPHLYKQPTLFIVGPTASGKSALAMRIAEEHGGEIICADSQTIRRSLDIRTAKPTREDQSRIPHHMLDIIDPYDRYSVSEFKEAAEAAIQDIESRGRLPIVVGGTGLYIDSLLYDFKFRGSSSEYTRLELEAMSVEQLQDLLLKKGLKMPGNGQNSRHLIRTIESEGQESKKGPLRKGAVVIGINPKLDVLRERISQRVEHMFKDGFIEEVERVVKQYGLPGGKVDAIGYNIALQNRDKEGKYDMDTIKELFVVADRQYAKRQRSWFRRNEDIMWFEQPDDAYQHLNKLFKK